MPQKQKGKASIGTFPVQKTDPERWRALKRDLDIREVHVPDGYKVFSASHGLKSIEIIVSDKRSVEYDFLEANPPFGYKRLKKEDACFMWLWNEQFKKELQGIAIWTGEQGFKCKGFCNPDQNGVIHEAAGQPWTIECIPGNRLLAMYHYRYGTPVLCADHGEFDRLREAFVREV